MRQRCPYPVFQRCVDFSAAGLTAAGWIAAGLTADLTAGLMTAAPMSAAEPQTVSQTAVV